MNDTCARCLRKGYGQTMYVIKLGEWRCRRHLPDFLKLDLEGYELYALQGAEQLLTRCKPVVCIEQKRFRDTEGRVLVREQEAGLYLERLGMRQVAKRGNDCIYVWET